MKKFLGLLFAKYIVFKNSFWISSALKKQKNLMFYLVKSAKNTRFGKDHNFNKIYSYNDFKKYVPIKTYEGLQHYVNCIISGEKDVLWPGKPIYFCKTSGTTSGTKFIPISKESIHHHIRGARDSIISYIADTKNAHVLDGKMIFIQGSPSLEKTGEILTGRLSGIVAHHVPFYLLKNRLPSFSTNCIDDWEKKIDAITEETLSQKMSIIGGIPPWVKMYFEKIIEKTGKNIGEVFPFFNLFIYGGVNYKPYKKVFEDLVGKQIDGVELYPASEGFLAYQNSRKVDDGMLLCVNHGVFYEFIEVGSFFSKNPNRICLDDVVLGVNYVLILNTDAGLWGYNIGDTVKFVSLDPYKIIVTGRVAHFTSAFGEHVIAEEVERSLALITKELSVGVVEFHVAPQVNPKKGLPHHEWFIEFDVVPKNLSLFVEKLDLEMQNQNSYYMDLVSGNILRPLEIVLIKKGGFVNYMKSVGRLGGQNKVPRLANDRIIAEKLLSYK